MSTDDLISVRTASRPDTDALLALDHVEERSGEVRKAIVAGRCLIAETTDGIVGFSIGGPFFGFDFLELLVVAEPFRRKGIGATLVRAWEERATTPKLFTSTNESTLPMQKLCEALGFVRSGFIQNLDEGDPEIVYFKGNLSGAA